MLSASTNRAILQPTRENRERRKSRIKSIREDVHQHNNPDSHRSSSSSGDASTSLSGKGKEKARQLPIVGNLIRNPSSSSSSSSKKSHSSQLVDLVVEDHEAAAVERVRARKEGGPGWNSVEQRHFVKTYGPPGAGVGADGNVEEEEVRQGFNPDRAERKVVDEDHMLSEPADAVKEGVVDEEGVDEGGARQPWEARRYDGAPDVAEEEREVWGGGK